MPMFFDRRLPRPGDEGLFRLLESLGTKAAQLALEPDAGIWEYRGRRRIHTHSAAMCWAGCHRLAAIAARLGLNDRAKYWDAAAVPLAGSFWNGPGMGDAKPLRPLSARKTWTPVSCYCLTWGSWKRPTRGSSARLRRWSVSSCARNTSCVMPALTISVCRSLRS